MPFFYLQPICEFTLQHDLVDGIKSGLAFLSDLLVSAFNRSISSLIFPAVLEVGGEFIGQPFFHPFFPFAHCFFFLLFLVSLD